MNDLCEWCLDAGRDTDAVCLILVPCSLPSGGWDVSPTPACRRCERTIERQADGAPVGGDWSRVWPAPKGWRSVEGGVSRVTVPESSYSRRPNLLDALMGPESAA